MTGESPIMTCEIFSHQLMDFLEGDVDGATRAAMNAHARQCAGCGALLAELRRVSAEASRLPALRPSRDLWSGIAERIEASVVGFAERRPLWKSPRLGGLAAAAALVVVAGLGYRALHHTGLVPTTRAVPLAATTAPAGDTARTAAPSQTQAPAAAPVTRGTEGARARLATDRAAEATPAAIEKSYDDEIAGLRAIIKQRHSQLNTTTVAVLERNLAVIDSAIAQCKSALATDPNSLFLMQSLSQSLDIKVQLMRMTAGLPSTT